MESTLVQKNHVVDYIIYIMKIKNTQTQLYYHRPGGTMKPILDIMGNFTPTHSDLARIMAAERNFQLDPQFWEAATTPGTDLVWKRNGSTFEIVTRTRQPIFRGAVHSTQKSVEIGAIENRGYKIFTNENTHRKESK